ncbi:MAG: HD domain-containing protein [Synergistaceae bacterium]|nr:HD domain-containing protein [Synergistaceae bacterium]
MKQNSNSNMNIKTVKQLPKNFDFQTVGIITRISTRTDRNGNAFWDITISDQSGDLEGKAWGNSTWYNNQGGDKFIIDPENCGFKLEGMTAGVIGHIGDFRDQLQYNFNDIYILDQNKYPPKNYTKRSPLNQEFLETAFKNLIAEISNEEIKSFLNAVFFKHNLWERYSIWPAAVLLHHAYSGGLLEHSVSVAIGARDMAQHYKDFKSPVDIDIVVAGALLHDIGKIEAYSAEPAPSVTVSGNVVEHIFLGYGMFMKFAELENLSENIKLAVAHIIISHHGRKEFGSPVLPATPEAFIVSAADDIDFKMSYWKNQIENLPQQNEVTDYLPLIDRRLWRGINAQ